MAGCEHRWSTAEKALLEWGDRSPARRPEFVALVNAALAEVREDAGLAHDFRYGKPTPEEIAAHDGRWLSEYKGSVTIRDNVSGCADQPELRWRPVTNDLWPAPWPARRGGE